MTTVRADAANDRARRTRCRRATTSRTEVDQLRRGQNAGHGGQDANERQRVKSAGIENGRHRNLPTSRGARWHRWGRPSPGRHYLLLDHVKLAIHAGQHRVTERRAGAEPGRSQAEALSTGPVVRPWHSNRVRDGRRAVAGRPCATGSQAALDGIVPLQCAVGACRTVEATMDAAGRAESRIRTRFIPRVLEALTLWFIAVVVLVLGYAQPASALHERCHGVVPSIVGTEGDDVIRGTSGPDVIFGLGGNDTIFGLAGDDLICAGDGNDTIFAGDGDDYANGNEGNDRIFGEAGNDFPLIGEGGDDKIFGGDGNDVLNGLPGNDLLVGGDGNDGILGWSGNDVVLAGAGDDVVTADEGDDIVFGGDGNDSLYGDARFPFDPVDVGTGNDWLFGQDGDDNLAGGPGIDRCDGGFGLDRTTMCEVIFGVP